MFIVDDEDRLLLMQERRDIGSEHTIWITPGGGVEPGESLSAGAVREVYEETGLVLVLDPEARPVYVDRSLFTIAGGWYDQTNHYFLARVESGVVIEPAAHTEIERLVVLGHRWWDLDDLDASPALREPAAIVEIVRAAMAAEAHG
jgi:8-oxo-dGTP pyrophosphatase MutT (NUDIX family)